MQVFGGSTAIPQTTCCAVTVHVGSICAAPAFLVFIPRASGE